MTELEIRYDGRLWVVETAGVSVAFSTLSSLVMFLLKWWEARMDKRRQEGL